MTKQEQQFLALGAHIHRMISEVYNNAGLETAYARQTITFPTLGERGSVEIMILRDKALANVAEKAIASHYNVETLLVPAETQDKPQ